MNDRDNGSPQQKSLQLTTINKNGDTPHPEVLGTPKPKFLRSFSTTREDFSFTDGVIRPKLNNVTIALRIFTLSSFFKHSIIYSDFSIYSIMTKDWPVLTRDEVYILSNMFSDKVEYTGPLLTHNHHQCFMAIMHYFVVNNLSLVDYQEINCSDIRKLIGLSKNSRNNKLVRYLISHLLDAKFTIHSGAFLNDLKCVWEHRVDYDESTRSFVESNLNFMHHMNKHSLTSGIFEKTSAFDPEAHYEGTFILKFTPLMMLLTTHPFRVHIRNLIHVSSYKQKHTLRLIEIISSFKDDVFDMGLTKWARLMLAPASVSKIIGNLDPDFIPVQKFKIQYAQTERQFILPLYKALQEAESASEIIPGWFIRFQKNRTDNQKATPQHILFTTNNIRRPPKRLVNAAQSAQISQQDPIFRLLILLQFTAYLEFFDPSQVEILTSHLSPSDSLAAKKKISLRHTNLYKNISTNYELMNLEGHQLNRLNKNDYRIQWSDETTYMFDSLTWTGVPTFCTRDLIAQMITHPLIQSSQNDSSNLTYPPKTIQTQQDIYYWESWLSNAFSVLKKANLLPDDVFIDIVEETPPYGYLIKNLSSINLFSPNAYLQSASGGVGGGYPDF